MPRKSWQQPSSDERPASCSSSLRHAWQGWSCTRPPAPSEQRSCGCGDCRDLALESSGKGGGRRGAITHDRRWRRCCRRRGVTSLWILGLFRQSFQPSCLIDPTRDDEHARLGVGLSALLFGDNLTPDNKLANVVGFVQVEETTDLRRTLRTKAIIYIVVRKLGKKQTSETSVGRDARHTAWGGRCRSDRGCPARPA
jgi:hypothetical protein